jgi:hypothetical protein
METRKKPAETSKTNISSMEERLLGTLKPIAPRREFVRGLGRHILAGNQGISMNKVADWPVLAALIAGLVSLAIFLAMVARALLSLSEKKRAA